MNMDQLVDDDDTPRDLPYKCDIGDCGRSFTNKAKRSHHKRSVHWIYYECLICIKKGVRRAENYLLDRKSDINIHFERLHPGLDRDLWHTRVRESSAKEEHLQMKGSARSTLVQLQVENDHLRTRCDGLEEEQRVQALAKAKLQKEISELKASQHVWNKSFGKIVSLEEENKALKRRLDSALRRCARRKVEIRRLTTDLEGAIQFHRSRREGAGQERRPGKRERPSHFLRSRSRPWSGHGQGRGYRS